jgi:dienelactone hydrolase
MGPYLYRNRWSVAWPKVQSFFDAIRCDEGSNLPIGAAGFCWGGKHAICLAHELKASNGKPLCDASFAAHPSSVDVPGDIGPVKKPVAIALGDQDFVMDIPTLEKVKEILSKEKVEYETRVYKDAGHGFAVRADPKNEKVMEQSVEAEDQAIAWFQKQFAKVGNTA